MKIFRIDGQPSKDDECEHGFRRFEKCPHCLEAANERLREALRYYAKNHYPDIDAGPWGPNSNDWGDVARAALGEKE